MATKREERLNVSWSYLAGMLAGGLGGSYLITHYVTNPKWLGACFLIIGVWGLVYSVIAGREALADARKVEEQHINGPVKVYAISHIRREIVRFIGHVIIFTLGLSAFLPPSWAGRWFAEYFITALFFLAFSLALNGTLDSSVRERMDKAADREKAETLRVERKSKKKPVKKKGGKS